MDDIATKFAYLNETKNLIKQAIIDKGVTVSDTDTFRSYADKITSIENITPSVVATDDVCRKNLCYWMDAIEHSGILDIDGTINTSAWWSKSGFCYFAPYNDTATTPWNEDSVTFNSSYHGVKEKTPLINTFKGIMSEMTYEITLSFNSFPSSDVSIIIGSVQSGGWSVHVLPSGRLRIYYYTTSYQTLDGGFYFDAPLNTKLYICARIKKTGIVSIYSTISGLNVNKEFTDTLSILNSAIAVGYNGDASGSYESQQAYINVNSFRIYNRYITDEEMLANCKYEVNRFNIPEYRILVVNPNVEGATVTLTADGYTQTDNYIKVLKGTEVTYSVSADGYTTQTGTIILDDSTTLDITLEAEGDWGGGRGDRV